MKAQSPPTIIELILSFNEINKIPPDGSCSLSVFQVTKMFSIIHFMGKKLFFFKLKEL